MFGTYAIKEMEEAPRKNSDIDMKIPTASNKRTDTIVHTSNLRIEPPSYCSQCGAKIEHDFKFCGRCGSSIRKNKTANHVKNVHSAEQDQHAKQERLGAIDDNSNTIQALRKWRNMSVYAIIANVVGLVSVPVFEDASLFVLISIVAVIVQLVAMHGMGSILKAKGVYWGFLIGMAVPVVALICLIIMHEKAAKALKLDASNVKE